jgi:exonuclease SbcD
MGKIRLLHFADLHVGTENYGSPDPATGLSSRVVDFLERFDELIDYALEHEADLVIFAGDAFKTRSPNPTYQRAFAKRVKRLADAGVPTVLLVGNHDLPAVLQRASSVDIFQTLDVPNVTVGRSEELHRLETKRGPVQVATVPYPVRQRLLAQEECASLSIDELDSELRRTVAEKIRSLAKEVDPQVPAVLAAHLSVREASYGSERAVMIGRDAVVGRADLADPAWDYVALGHIHMHQSLNGDAYPPIVYSGSLERIDFGEEGQLKGFCWVELARGKTTWQFVELPARPFVTVEADLREAEDPLESLRRQVEAADVTDAVVRVILHLTPEQDPQLRDREVRSLFTDAHLVASVSREVERVARVRLDGLSPEEMTDLDLLKEYLKTKDTPAAQVKLLLKHAQEIIDAESDA